MVHVVTRRRFFLKKYYINVTIAQLTTGTPGKVLVLGTPEDDPEQTPVFLPTGYEPSEGELFLGTQGDLQDAFVASGCLSDERIQLWLDITKHNVVGGLDYRTVLATITVADDGSITRSFSANYREGERFLFPVE